MKKFTHNLSDFTHKELQLTPMNRFITDRRHLLMFIEISKRYSLQLENPSQLKETFGLPPGNNYWQRFR